MLIDISCEKNKIWAITVYLWLKHLYLAAVEIGPNSSFEISSKAPSAPSYCYLSILL